MHPKELITWLKAIMISHEYPNPNCNAITKKFFTAPLLAATNYSKDTIEEILIKIDDI